MRKYDLTTMVSSILLAGESVYSEKNKKDDNYEDKKSIELFLLNQIVTCDFSDLISMNAAYIIPAKIVEFISESKDYHDLDYAEKEFMYSTIANFDIKNTTFIKYYCLFNKLDEVDFSDKISKYRENNTFLESDLKGFLKSICVKETPMDFLNSSINLDNLKT